MTKKPNTIEKFTGSFSAQKGGCTIIVNSTINAITNVYALSVYSYLMCRPDTWQLNAKQLASHLNCGRNTIYKALTYLMDMNLLTREDIREKGKFLKSHYVLYDRPQLDKGISPYPSTRDTVRRDTVKRDAYKTKNIQNKKYKTTTTISDSSNEVIISKEKDKLLLKSRDVYLKGDERSDEEFLKQCKQHLESNKDKYTETQRFKGLQKIIMTGSFEKPKGFKSYEQSKISPDSYLNVEIKNQTPEELEKRGRNAHREYMREGFKQQNKEIPDCWKEENDYENNLDLIKDLVEKQKYSKTDFNGHFRGYCN